MSHLQTLSWAGYGMALFFGLFAAVFALAGVTFFILPVMAGASVSEAFPTLFGLGMSSLYPAGLCLMYLVAARTSVKGRRGFQTIAAVLSITNCPGVFYAGYALWVCYVNPETRGFFEQGAPA